MFSGSLTRKSCSGWALSQPSLGMGPRTNFSILRERLIRLFLTYTTKFPQQQNQFPLQKWELNFALIRAIRVNQWLVFLISTFRAFSSSAFSDTRHLAPET
jgi:hypothetical protein